MKKRQEEELIELAFRDLTEDESKRMTESLSGDAQRTVREYTQMRCALKELRDIPEMQLSSDRLRDAILREGLKPAKVSFWARVNWTTGIGVAATLALCAWYLNRPVVNPISTGGTFAMKSERSDRSMDPVLDFAPRVTSVTPSVQATLSKKVASRPPASVASASVREPRRRSWIVRSAPRLVAKRESTAAGRVESVASFGARREAAAPAITTAMESGMPAADSASVPNSIVVIDSTPTQDGVNRAVEVQSASNVLIGG